MKLRNTTLSIATGAAWLDARLAHAPNVAGLIVILKPGSVADEEGREAYIARTMQASGYATLTVDLLTHHEETRDPDARYNVPQLASRIEGVRDWIAHQPPLEGLAVGLISCDTATGAAIRTAARHPGDYAAIAARGGRADLAGGGPLRALATPLCLVVGDQDPGRAMIRHAFELVSAPNEWVEAPGVSELFIEPGALDGFCRHAAAWFARHLPPPQPRASSPEPGATREGGGPATAD